MSPTMDFQYILRKAEFLWKYTSELNAGQYLMLGLVIYMLPQILQTVFNIVGTMIKSVVWIVMFSIIAGVTINLYLGNGSEIAEMINYSMRFTKKALKSLLLD